MPGAGSTRPRRPTAPATPPPSSSDPTTDWAKAVVAGEIVAGPHIRNTCRRHLRDLETGAQRDLTFDVEAANRAIRFFPAVLRLAGGQFERKPFELAPSQKFKIGSLFGWKRISTGKRRFRRAYIEEAKGNGKSPLAAGIGIYGLIADHEARAEIYAAAAKRDQAMVLFRDAVAMREQSPALRRRLKQSGLPPNVWNLADLKTGSFFRPISSDDAQSGPRPHVALCDELHEHKDGSVVDMLEAGFKWREQPLLVMITNSGSDLKSKCGEEHAHAVKVAAGDVEDDDTFSFVCSLDEAVIGPDGEEIRPRDNPLTDPSCWVKANPLLGVTVQESYLAKVVRQATQLPGKLNLILRLHFCRWTDADTAWIARETLERCLADFDPSIHAGKSIDIGLDLSGTQDLTALACVVQTGTMDIEVEHDDGQVQVERLPTFDAWIEAWTPKDTLEERTQADKAPYDVWVREGWLNAIQGVLIRFGFVARRVQQLAAEFRIRELAYDRYAYGRFRDELDELGLTLKQIEHPQGGKRKAKAPDDEIEAAKAAGEDPPEGLWMPGSLVALEEMLLQGRIRLRRNPVLVSACMSAATEHDAFENRWFSKQRATQRIDPLVALAMAVGSAVRKRPGPKAPSYLENDDVLFV